MSESERILTEDALKHLHRSEEQGQAVTVESIAGALGVNKQRATTLLALLQKVGLATLKDGLFRLTVKGAADARRIVRAHRLYETYLAERTGRAETAWHREADIHEHKLTREEVNNLAKQLGHPRFDPHGDPIPTAQGALPTTQGKSLADLPVGTIGRIVHIEDEPDTIYAQLVSLGVCPGMEVRVVESTPQRIVIWADGEQIELVPIAAANISVLPTPDELRGAKIETQPLSALKPGQSSYVVSLSPRCRGAERRRLLDLGIVPNTEIEVVMRSPAGDPTAYRVRQTLVALRKEQADLINVARRSEETR